MIAYEEHGEDVFVEYSQTIKENNPSGVFRHVRRLYQRGERGFGDDIPIVLDRFHIAKLYRKGLDELRKKEMKRLKKELSKEEYSKRQAKRKINRWKKRVIKSGLTCFNSFLATLDKWMNRITNYFIGVRLSTTQHK